MQMNINPKTKSGYRTSKWDSKKKTYPIYQPLRSGRIWHSLVQDLKKKNL